MRFCVLLLVMSHCCVLSMAQTSSLHSSLHESFTPADTFYVFVDQNKDLYLYHPSDTSLSAFELAGKYNVLPGDILSAAGFAEVPRDSSAYGYLVRTTLDRIQDSDCFYKECIPVVYTVRPKETVFRIARRYFDLRTEQLKEMNGLPSNELSIGQRLVVGWFAPPAARDTSVVDSAWLHLPADPFENETPTMQAGVAFWNKTSPDALNMFALHRTARVHSMIEITNPMMKTRVLVKVIGRIPPTYTDDIALVVSPAVARRLAVLDPRFRVEMRFVE